MRQPRIKTTLAINNWYTTRTNYPTRGYFFNSFIKYRVDSETYDELSLTNKTAKHLKYETLGYKTLQK